MKGEAKRWTLGGASDLYGDSASILDGPELQEGESIEVVPASESEQLRTLLKELASAARHDSEQWGGRMAHAYADAIAALYGEET